MQKNNKKSAQEIQDEIFRKMPADKKLELGSRLWLLAKELTKDKPNYGINRSETITGKSR
ncbi:MAG: hypothetical protein HYT64_01590 [Candidatus Yanofskybacteria bacterium]|nr:hypothetical protein [Candidatus Yanofskybacteria bacterium]